MYVEMLCIITSINQAQSLWIKEFNFKGVNTLALSLPLRLPHPLGDYSKCVCAYHSLQSTLTEEAFLENGLNGLFRGKLFVSLNGGFHWHLHDDLSCFLSSKLSLITASKKVQFSPLPHAN